jgi:general secretion pathway protein D
VEASLDNLRDLGAKWRVTGTHDGEPVVVGGVGKVDSTTMQGIIYGLSGVTVGGAGNYMNYTVTDPADPTKTKNISAPGFAALFSMSEFRGAVNVLSSPQILTADNSKAEIHVGENVPFISKTETNTAGLATKSIERKDVGIKLEILPQITEGENVKLELYQEISSVKESSVQETVDVGPTTTKRSTKTTVIVQDGRTVVISGLMQERTEEVETRVPLLHRIPILGWLFKYRSTTKVKNNLLVFLTPHIINDASDLGDITSEREKTFAQKENMLVPGHFVVRFMEGTEDAIALSIIETHDAFFVEKQKDNGYAARLLEPKEVEGVIEDLLKVPEVTAIEPYYRLKTF